MKIKYIIFDIGNVCYPYSPDALGVYLQSKTEDKAHFTKIWEEDLFDFDPILKGEVTFSQFCKDACEAYCIKYTKEIETEIAQADHDCLGPFYEETKELMMELSSQGYEICLLSNITADLEDIVPQMVSKDKRFLSYELGLRKPDPEIYKTVLQRLNAAPSEVLFIDDTQVNVEAAQKLGITAIIFDKNTIKQEVRKIISK